MSDYKIEINSKTYQVSVEAIVADKAFVKVNGQSYEVKVPESREDVSGSLSPKKVSSTKAEIAQMTSQTELAHRAGSICSPLPGVILSLNVKQGDSVKRGQKLAVLEAMKMENDILATADGSVKEVFVQVGDSVRQGAELMIVG